MASENDSAALLEELRDSVVEGEQEKCVELTHKAVGQSVSPQAILDQALIPGMKITGDKWERMEIFLPEAVLAAAAMKAAMAIIIPLFKESGSGWQPRGKVVLGTVKGDLHDIGKTIVANIMAANGFEVEDLGTDVSPDRFLEAAERGGADIIGCSALMTTTMPVQRDVVDFVEATGERGRFVVLVGGAPTTEEWAEKISADGWGRDAYDACAKAIAIIEEKRAAAGK